MTKGKPWDINEIRQLRQLVEEGKGIDEISRLMVKTKDAVRQKMMDLGLKVLKEEERVVSQKKARFSYSKLDLPEDLLTVEETLRILAACLRKGTEAGLGKDEVQRLQVVANIAEKYKSVFAEYLDYRGLEERLVELEAKYDALIKKGQKNATA
jgi:hypothetical protein